MKVTESARSAIKALDSHVPHPTSGAMVVEAVQRLGGGRGGLSLQSIKKYITENHVVVDQKKQDALTRKAIKKLVDEGSLVQVKGTGASGSFKLATATKKKSVVMESQKKTKPALKIKTTGSGCTPVKSSRKPLVRKSDAAKEAEVEKATKADAERKRKKTVPEKSIATGQKVQKSSEKVVPKPKPAAKKQSSKKK